MTTSLTLSSHLYECLLLLYPEDLRRDYGAEMALAFAEDIDTARRDAGIWGVIRIWRCALVEFLRFALPGHASNPAFRVPVILVAFAIGSIGIEWVLRSPGNAPVRFRAAALLVSFASVLTPLLVVWVCRGKPVFSLGLCNHTGEDE
jgi:hypothetical protein